MILNNCNISDISIFKDFKGDYLDLSNNPIEDLTPLKDIQIWGLALRNTNITDVSSLNNIVSLDLSGNDSLQGLDKLLGTASLTLDDCNISDLNSLVELVNLNYLSLNNNNITDISLITNLNQLNWLHLSNNQISEIPNLSVLSNLNFIDLSSNGIIDISELSNLQYISANLDNNKISTIPEDNSNNDYSLQNQNINSTFDIAINKNNRIQLPNIIYKASKESTILHKAAITSENCIIDFKSKDIIIKPTVLGKGTSTIRIDGGIYSGTIYTINYICQESLNIVGLEISTLPTKLKYIGGENFDSTGMMVKATYENGITEFVDNYDIINGSNLEEGQESVTIQYGDLTQEVNISVYPKDSVTIQFEDKALYYNICNNIGEENIIYSNDNTYMLIIPKNILENITTLSFSSEDLSNLTGLSSFYNLTNLAINYTDITDITELSKLTKLEVLNLKNNTKITDVSCLQTLTNLKEIYIENTSISDISAIKKLPNINKITISKSIWINEIDTIGNSKVIVPEYVLDTEEMQGQNTIKATISFVNTVGSVNSSTNEDNLVGGGPAYDETTSILVELPIYYDEQNNPYIIIDSEISEVKPSGMRKIEISIDEGIVSTKFGINYEVRVILDRIEITEEPAKLDYKEGENFDSAGMEVYKVYNDGTREQITDYKIQPNTPLTSYDKEIKISYTDNYRITRTTTLPITVTHEHIWNEGETTKAPNCLEKGEITYTCTKCNETKTEELPVTEEHIWDEGEIAKEPNCLEKGEITYICTICDKTRKEEVSQTGHKYENGVCTNCGENLFTEDSKYYIIASNFTGINPNTPFAKFIENIRQKYTAKIFKDILEITEGNIATGMSIKIFEGEKEVGNYTAVVTGDTDGDGDANIKDMIKINNYRLYGTTNNFEGVYQTAADVNRDENIDIKDMIRINNYRLYGTNL